jgi:tetratricopeptide (TPR) repeat protein
MHTMIRRTTMLLILLCLTTVQAAIPTQVPMPLGIAKFVEPDVTARIYFSHTDTARGRARLDRHLERRPNDSRALAGRAYQAAIDGQVQLALADLDRARAAAQGSSRREREVLWSQGWIHLNLGQFNQAAAAWNEALQRHQGKPYWIPYSFAVLAELAGERTVALAWYEIAAHSWPSVWGTRHGMQQHTRHWRDGERAAIYRLYDAWVARQ